MLPDTNVMTQPVTQNAQRHAGSGPGDLSRLADVGIGAVNLTAEVASGAVELAGGAAEAAGGLAGCVVDIFAAILAGIFSG